MVVPAAIDENCFPSSPLCPEQGKPDLRLEWQTEPAHEYQLGEGEMITIQPAETVSPGTALLRRLERYSRRKTQTKCEIRETYSPSIHRFKKMALVANLL